MLESTNEWEERNTKTVPFDEGAFKIQFDLYNGDEYRISTECVVPIEDLSDMEEVTRLKTEASNYAKNDWLIAKAEEQASE